jgi:hypothetical protein
MLPGRYASVVARHRLRGPRQPSRESLQPPAVEDLLEEAVEEEDHDDGPDQRQQIDG